MTAAVRITDKIRCPHCGGNLHRVTDSRPRLVGSIYAVARRRACDACQERTTTLEFCDADLTELVNGLLSERASRIAALRAELAELEAVQ